MKKGWSLEQIAGRLKKESGYTVISHEMTYAYIYDTRALDERYYLHLSRKCRYHKPRVSCNHRKGPIPNRIDINERSENISSRKTFDHWEGDLILFKDTRSNLITVRERKSHDSPQWLLKEKEERLIARQWMISCNAAQRLIERIELEQKSKILTYSVGGKSGHNCLSWCIKQLEDAYIPIDTQPTWRSFICAVPSDYLPEATPEHNTN